MTTPGFTVRLRGKDSSGRSILMTDYAWAVWQDVLEDPTVKPFAHLVTIVQGAFMARLGGGATASAGYHDLGGCWDIRTWNLTVAQQLALIWALRRRGIAAWRRNAQWGGMDPHIHVVMGSDKPLASGAAVQWRQYLANQSGLSSGGRDYERRPSPLVTTPPASVFQEDYMATDAAQKDLAAIKASQAKIIDLLEADATADAKRWTAERERDRQERARQSQRYADLVAKIGGLADALSGDARDAVLKILREEQDVTGADNPATES